MRPAVAFATLSGTLNRQAAAFAKRIRSEGWTDATCRQLLDAAARENRAQDFENMLGPEASCTFDDTLGDDCYELDEELHLALLGHFCRQVFRRYREELLAREQESQHAA